MYYFTGPEDQKFGRDLHGSLRSGLPTGCNQDFSLPQSSQGSTQVESTSKLSGWLLIGYSVILQAVGLSEGLSCSLAIA